MASKLPRNQIVRVLAERSLATGVSTRDLSEHVAAYLLEERRTADLEPLLRDIMKYRADKGIVEVTAVSAFPITDTIRADITAQIKDLYPAAKEIIVSEEIRKDVVGGVRLELPDQQFDLSVRARLSRLKQLTAVGK